MAISLVKGQRISLEKDTGAKLTEVLMGLGWDSKVETTAGFLGFGKRTITTAIDLDASCLMFDEAKHLVDTIWFRQLKSRDGSVIHTGDNRTGAGDGDDEQIRVNLAKVPGTVKTLVFTVNCYSNTDFAKVENAYCRLVDETSHTEVARFNLSCGGPHTAMIMAKVYRHEGGWKMHAVGDNATGRTADQLLPAILPSL